MRTDGHRRNASMAPTGTSTHNQVRFAGRACQLSPPMPRASRTTSAGCRTTARSISLWLVNRRPAPSPRAAPGIACGSARRCPPGPLRARSREASDAPLANRRRSVAAPAAYRRNAARVAAAVELKYPGGSAKPRSWNARPLVRAPVAGTGEVERPDVHDRLERPSSSPVGSMCRREALTAASIRSWSGRRGFHEPVPQIRQAKPARRGPRPDAFQLIATVVGRAHLVAELLESLAPGGRGLGVDGVGKRQGRQQVLTRRALTARVLTTRSTRAAGGIVVRQRVQPSGQPTEPRSRAQPRCATRIGILSPLGSFVTVCHGGLAVSVAPLDSRSGCSLRICACSWVAGSVWRALSRWWCRSASLSGWPSRSSAR